MQLCGASQANALRSLRNRKNSQLLKQIIDFSLLDSFFFIQHYFIHRPTNEAEYCRVERVHMMMIDSEEKNGRHSTRFQSIILQ